MPRSVTLKKWIYSRIKDNSPAPREMMYLERKARLERIKQTGLTPPDAWAIYCSPDPLYWTAHWFNISQSLVRNLQKSPNEGKRWTSHELAEMGPSFRTQRGAVRSLPTTAKTGVE